MSPLLTAAESGRSVVRQVAAQTKPLKPRTSTSPNNGTRQAAIDGGM